MKEYEKSERGFDKCYQINSKHQGTRFQMFLKRIKTNNSENFRYILFGLIYLGPYKKDLTYSDFINTLLSINSNVFSYNIDVYLKGYYLALANDNFDEDKVYLNIIKEGEKFGQPCLYII